MVDFLDGLRGIHAASQDIERVALQAALFGRLGIDRRRDIMFQAHRIAEIAKDMTDKHELVIERISADRMQVFVKRCEDSAGESRRSNETEMEYMTRLLEDYGPIRE